jgi:hypothetical protein
MTGPEKRSFEPDRSARPDEPGPDEVAPDSPDEAKLKRHGDDLQSSLDKATHDDRPGRS